MLFIPALHQFIAHTVSLISVKDTAFSDLSKLGSTPHRTPWEKQPDPSPPLFLSQLIQNQFFKSGLTSQKDRSGQVIFFFFFKHPYFVFHCVKWTHFSIGWSEYRVSHKDKHKDDLSFFFTLPLHTRHPPALAFRKWNQHSDIDHAARYRHVWEP